MCARARGRDWRQLEPAGRSGARTSLPALPPPPALVRSRSPPAARGPPSVLSLVRRLPRSCRSSSPSLRTRGQESSARRGRTRSRLLEVSRSIPSSRLGSGPDQPALFRPPARRLVAIAPHLLLSAGSPWPRPLTWGPAPEAAAPPASPRKRAPPPPVPLPPPGRAWWSPSRPPSPSLPLRAAPGWAGALGRPATALGVACHCEARVAVGS